MSEVKRRADIYTKCLESPEFMGLEWARCRDDIFHFIENWVWTFDPRAKPAHLPFKLYPFQKDAILWLEDMYVEDLVGILEKSRDVGATWIAVTWVVHRWLFDDGFTCLFGSKTEADVDDNSVDSIFGKIRYILGRLPKFLCPDLSEKINDRRAADSYLSIVNPTNGNEITGDSANDNFGRSGRRSIVFLDEMAFLPHSDRIWASVSEVSNCIIGISTPNGKGNMFHHLRTSGKVPVLSLHWSKHPLKDKDWYEDKKRHMSEWQIAQELDLSYDNSRMGKVYKAFKREWHISDKPIDPNPLFEQFCTMDYGIRDAMVAIFGQIDTQGDVEILADFDITDFDIELFIYLLQGQQLPPHIWMLMHEDDRNNYLRILNKMFSGDMNGVSRSVYGDHAGTARSANNTRSIKDRLRTEGGIRLITTPKQDFANRIQCLGNLFKLKQNKITGDLTSRFKISPDCPRTIDALNNYVWAGDADSANPKPKHDAFSHHTSALEFFSISRFPILSQGKTTVEKIR